MQDVAEAVPCVVVIISLALEPPASTVGCYGAVPSHF